MSNKIVGADRDFVLLRAAEGTAILSIQKELADRGLDVTWNTVNKCVEQNLGDVERIRMKMLKSGLGSYATASYRLSARNKVAKTLYEMAADLLDKRNDCSSSDIRDLKILLGMWDDLVESIRTDAISVDSDEQVEEIAEIVGSMDSGDQMSVIEDLKKNLPGRTA